MNDAWIVKPLVPALLPAWEALFVRASSPCHCRWWHFVGTKNDWLARCAHEPTKNAAEQAELVQRGSPEAGGLVALDPAAPENVVGWMKIGPRPAKLRGLPVYRELPLEEGAGVVVIGCFLVDPAVRQRGVARALLAAAPAHARGLGARAIEAYPRRCDDRISDDEAWMGPHDAFVAAGFRPAHEAFAQYPVLRLALD
jgi:GNAT superfamily N-acetyltransferase